MTYDLGTAKPAPASRTTSPRPGTTGIFLSCRTPSLVRLLLTLRLHQLTQKLWRQIRPIRPGHGVHHWVLDRSGKQRRVEERAEQFALEFIGQIHFT